MPEFRARSALPELMDDPGIPTAELAHALDDLETINRWLGGYAPSLAGIQALLGEGRRDFSLLDVGAGGGDFARRVFSWAERRRQRARVTAVDLLPAAVEHARARSVGLDGLRFEVSDLFHFPAQETFDVVHAALILHHFNDGRAVEALARMYALSRLGIVVNDLHRHPLAYHSIKLLTRLLSRNRLIRHDAPVSVLRAFRREELECLVRGAGLPAPAIRWRWGFRWQVVVPKGILPA